MTAAAPSPSNARVRAAESVDPALILERLRARAITHVVTVPDTHQKSLLALLSGPDAPQLITACTEDEVMGINLGLYAGGQRPMLLIQNSGLWAAMNTLRALALDGRVPTPMLVGEYSRRPEVAPAEDPRRLIRLLEPTLALWGIPSYRLDAADEVSNVTAAIDRAYADRGPTAILVGATTADLA
jgi:sulfopyruvate decarboxylase TPP-binding subunit